MKKNEAKNYYEAAVADLIRYCEKETDLSPVIMYEEYPFRVQFIPDPQQTVLGNENVDENGEINDLTVTVGLTTTVKSTLKFKMDSKQLKKLIKFSEKLGRLYYQAFREEAGDLRIEGDTDDILRNRHRMLYMTNEDEKERELRDRLRQVLGDVENSEMPEDCEDGEGEEA